MNKTIQRKISLLFTADSKMVGTHMDNIHNKLDRLKSAAGTVFKYLGIGSIASAAGMVMLAKEVVNVAAMFERFRTQLKVLYGSADIAKEKFQWLREFAMTTPYRLPEIVSAAVGLKAVGLQFETYMKDIGDLASGMRVPIEEVADVFQKLASGVMGRAMIALRRLGISARTLKTEGIHFETTGTPVESYMEVIQAIQRVIHKRFPDMMQEHMKGWSGLISNLDDQIEEIKAAFGTKIIEFLKPKLKMLIDYLTDLVESGKVEVWAQMFIDKVKSAYDKLMEIVPKVWHAIKIAGEALWSAISPILNFFVEHPGTIAGILLIKIMMSAVSLARDFSSLIVSAVKVAGSGLASFGRALTGGAAAGTAGGVAGGVAGNVATTAAASYTPFMRSAMIPGAAMAGSAAGGLGAGGATAAGFLGLGVSALAATVIAILGVVGVAAVMYSIYDHLTAYKKERDTSKMTEAELIKYGLKTEAEPAGAELAAHQTQLASDLYGGKGEFATQAVRDAEKAAAEEKNRQLLETQRLEQIQIVSEERAGDIREKLASNREKLDQEAFEFSIRMYSEEGQQRAAIEKKYADIVSGIRGDALISMSDKEELYDAIHKQRSEELGRFDIALAEQQARDLVKAREEAMAKYRDLDRQLALATEDIKYRDASDAVKQQLDLERQYYDERIAIVNDGVLTMAERVRYLNTINEIIAARTVTIETDAMAKRKRVWATGMAAMENVTVMWANKQIRTNELLKALTIKAASETIAAELELQAKKWETIALGYAASLNFLQAARYTAGAIALTAGAALVRSMADRELAKYQEKIQASEQSNPLTADTYTDEYGSTTKSGYTTSGNSTYYIQPSLYLSAETMIIGDAGLEHAATTIKDIAVQGIKEAIETGELSLNGVG